MIKIISQMILLFLLIPCFANAFLSHPDQYAFQYEGHLSFPQQFGVEGYYELSGGNGGWFSNSAWFAGATVSSEFDFFEFPIGIQSEIYNYKASKWDIGFGFAASTSFTTNFEGYSVTIPRICPYVPFNYNLVKLRIEYCVVKKQGFKLGIGVLYEI